MAAPAQKTPSETLNIGVIGVGGRGADDLEGVKSENIVALCDVDWDRAAGTFAKYPQATKHRDFRRMLEQEKGLDAVVVATPDHTHAVASMAAIKAGKHVYCEKPLTRTVFEARALAKAAREAKVATQMGNQGMAFEGNRLINEWLADGAIGPVREVHVWSDRPTHKGKLPLWWAQGIERPADTPPVPATLDWDLWLGPAPWRPYHPAYVPFRWRGWWDFGSGGLGDMGIHNLAPGLCRPRSWARRRASTRVRRPSSRRLSRWPRWCTISSPPGANSPPSLCTGTTAACCRPALRNSKKTVNWTPKTASSSSGHKGKMLVEGWGGERPRLIPESRHRDYQSASPKPAAFDWALRGVDSRLQDGVADAIDFRFRRTAHRSRSPGHGLRAPRRRTHTLGQCGLQSAPTYSKPTRSFTISTDRGGRCSRNSSARSGA